MRMKEVLEDSSFKDFKIYKCQSFRVPPWMIPDISFCMIDIKKSDHSSRDIHSIFNDHLQCHECTEAIYTDGSKTNTTVGCAAVMDQSEYSAKLSNAVSSFSSELIAILLVIKNILYRQNKNSFTIFSDSKSALNAVNKFYPDSPIVLDIHYFLFRIFDSGKHVSFCWSPGHVGIRGNEDADRAAKSAASRETVNYLPIPLVDAKYQSRSFIMEKFQNIWSGLSTNQKLKLIKQDTKPWPTIKTDNRRDIKVLNRLRIGHTHLTHRFLMQTPQLQPMCDRCRSPLTVKHFLVDCPAYNHFREKWKIPGTMMELLGEEVDIFNLITFLKEIDLYYDI